MFSKNTQTSNFMKIRPVGAELFHADGRTRRTDMTKPTVAFHNFANASKNVIITKILYYSYNVSSFFDAFSYTLQSVYYNNSVHTPVRVKQLQGHCENLLTFDRSGGHPVYFSNSIHQR
jgi:hypothetical protein